jgi:hypothetical protein
VTIYFMGGELSALLPSDSNTNETTLSGRFDSAFARCSTKAYTSSGYSEASWSTDLDTLYLHFEYRQGNGTGGGTVTMFELVDSGGTAVYRARATASSIQLEDWTGAAWASSGSALSLDTANGLNTFDFWYDSTTGAAKLYVGGTLRLSVTGGTFDDDIRKVRFYGRDLVSDSNISQVVVADEPTIGFRVATYYPNGAGSDSAWTGTYTNIDEVTNSDADFINSATNGQVSTFAVTGPALTGYTVRAVSVSTRAKKGASGPANLRHAIRSAGTNYFSGSDIALDVGYTAVQTIWETDPATSAAWVNAAATSLQAGVKAIT